jgi:hypothetical protein
MFRENPAGRKSGITLLKNYGPRTWKALTVFVVAACAARKWIRLRYCASERSCTPLRAGRRWARHHFAARSSVDWYAYHRLMPLLMRQFTVVADDLRGLGDPMPTEGGYDVNSSGPKLAFREAHAKLRRCVAGAWVRKL